MLTVDFGQLGLRPGDTVLDLGAGLGRHSFECYKRGAKVVALDLNQPDIAKVAAMFTELARAGEGRPGEAIAVVGDAYHLPFADASFDIVIASEILEHIPDDQAVMAEAVRVLKPGGTLAVTVPRWWPELVCWALADEYHAPAVEGGHIRIYRADKLVARLTAAGLTLRGTHHAHALHSPLWWLRCGLGMDSPIADAYHKLLVYDLMHKPWWTRVPERLLNPVAGKSFVAYLSKPA